MCRLYFKGVTEILQTNIECFFLHSFLVYAILPCDIEEKNNRLIVKTISNVSKLI